MKKYSSRQRFSCSLTRIKFDLCDLFMSGGSLTMGPNSTLCLTICWVILAVWVPMGSAEVRRLSVALSHSPRGSRASWNWRAKTCSSSNCLCLRDGRGGGTNIQRDEEEEEEAFIGILLLSLIFPYAWLLNFDLILCHRAVVFFINSLLNVHQIVMIYYWILKNFNNR